MHFIAQAQGWLAADVVRKDFMLDVVVVALEVTTGDGRVQAKGENLFVGFDKFDEVLDGECLVSLVRHGVISLMMG